METPGKTKKKVRKLPPNNQANNGSLSPRSQQTESNNQTRAKFDELLKAAVAQNESETGKVAKKKKKARAQTAEAVLETLKKGEDFQKSTRDDPTALNNTFNAEDSPRYTKNTTNARRKKLPPKKGQTNKGFLNDDGGMEMGEMGWEDEDGGVKKKKKKRKQTAEEEDETAIDYPMTRSELEDTSKKPQRRKKKTAEPEEEDAISKATDDVDGGTEDGAMPRDKGKKKKKKKKSTTIPLPTDDGQVLGVTVHRSDRLKPDLYIAHPLVRLHIIDNNTGTYVKKSSKERPVTSFYENQNEKLDYILPVLTQPFDFKQRRSMIPNWEDQIIFNESYQFLTQNRDDCPKAILFFEILDFVSMSIASTKPQVLKGQGTWHRIAWAFLKVVGSNGAPNTEKRVRLQLFYPPFAYKAKPDQLDVFQWWQNLARQPYPATLYVTVKGIKPPEEVNPAGRSLFATQEERGTMTYQELKETMSMRNKDQNKKTKIPTIWTKLPGQTCRIPNKELLSLAGNMRGCHAIKFSPDGHLIACACKDKDGYPILIYEIQSGRLKGQFPGHYGLIYDISWNQSTTGILTASSDGTARIWHLDMPDSAALKVFPHPSFVYTARFHPTNETLIITGGYDSIIRVWSMESNAQAGELLYEYEGHKGFVNCLAFSPDGTKMYSGDSDGEIIGWRSTGSEGNWMIQQEIKVPEVQGVPINSLRVHPSGRRLLVHCRDNNIRMIDLRLFCIMQHYIGVLNFREQIRSTLSPCGSFVFSGSEDRHGYVWNTDTGEQIAAYSRLGYRQPVCDVDYHPHEHMVALCSRGDGHPVQIYIYDAKVAQLTVGFSRARFGENVEEGHVTEEEDRLIGTMKARQDLDEELEEKKAERLARVKTKLSSVLALKDILKTIRDAPQGGPQYNPGGTSLMQSTYGQGASSINMSGTWGSTFDYTNTSWQNRTQGPAGYSPAGTGRPNWTSTPYRKGPMPNIDLQAESDGKAIFTFKAPVIQQKDKVYPKVVALYDYTAQRSDELHLKKGNVISVLHRDNENWWMGQLANGQQGYFPANYVSYEGEQEDQSRLISEYEEQLGYDDTDVASPGRMSKVKGHGRNGGTPHKKSKETYSAVVTKSGELKFYSGAEESEQELNSATTPRRRKKKTVTMAANLLHHEEPATPDSPSHRRPPKGHSRSRTTPAFSQSAALDSSQDSMTNRTPRKKKVAQERGTIQDDSGTESTPRRRRRGLRENLLADDYGTTPSAKMTGGKRKAKTKHLDTDEEDRDI